MYVFQLFDAFSGSGSVLLLVVIGECLAIGWFYGKKNKQNVWLFLQATDNFLAYSLAGEVGGGGVRYRQW